jgi:signal transduction histidine kinase
LLQWVLGLHLPALFVFGLVLHHEALYTAELLLPPLLLLLAGRHLTRRRPASVCITAGLTYCSAALVVLTRGSIEAHFHFFIIIGFIALYQDWVPFLWNVGFTVLSHGLGSAYKSDLIFDYPAAQQSPWIWSGIHGLAVLFACVGMVFFWRVSEEEQRERTELSRQLVNADRRRFTSQLLVNLARRNQSMLYRQLDIINQLEEKERDPDALAELFRLDHLATRVRRNAESLLVLAGEQPARVWSAPVALHEVIRAAIAETDDLERVDIAVDEGVAVTGRSVTDVTHLLAELTENAVRYSPPHAGVTIRSRGQSHGAGAHLVIIEDWGVGMPPHVVTAYNRLLADPPEVDLAVPQQLGFHVVARLAERHDIEVTLTPTPGGGVTAAVLLPAGLVIGQASAEPEHPVWEYRIEPRPGTRRWRHAPVRSRHALGPPLGSVLEAEPVDWTVTMPRQGAAPEIESGPRRPPPIPARSDSAPAWTGWWIPNEPGDPPPSMPWSDAPPWNRPSPDAGVAAGSTPEDPPNRTEQHPEHDPAQPPGEPRLNRRVPQTHLAPELRLPAEEPEEAMERPPNPPYALTHYQASRKAASSEAAEDRPGNGRADDPVHDSRGGEG